MTGVMSYAADPTEDAEQGAPTESATQNADAPESAPPSPGWLGRAAPALSDTEVIVASPTEMPPAPTGSTDPEPAPAVSAPRPVDLPADVVDVARAAAASEAGTADRIGEHVDSIAEDPIARTVRFAALDAGYRGWQWSVTLALLPDEPPTVSEVVLLPGPDALVAPAWLPWDQRVRPGDLGPTDLLPAAADDPRLVPGYVESDDPALEDLATEVGLGRARVLSREGRDDAADRWHDGPFGPGSPVAKAAPALCGTCGFYAPLAGSLGGAFGVCANDLSPADARVVDVAFGCGAHSEVPAPPPAVPVGGTVLDEVTLEVHDRPRVRAAAAEDAAADGDAGDVSVADSGTAAADAPHDAAPGQGDPVDQDTAALTDAVETAPTLDVVAEAGDLAAAAPPVAPDPDAVEPAVTAAVDDREPTVEAVAEAVAVEPETVSAAGAVSGSDAEIVVAEPDVIASGGPDGQLADADATPAASAEPTDPADGEPTTG